jgi:Zn-dependent metalloprotease
MSNSYDPTQYPLQVRDLSITSILTTPYVKETPSMKNKPAEACFKCMRIIDQFLSDVFEINASVWAPMKCFINVPKMPNRAYWDEKGEFGRGVYIGLQEGPHYNSVVDNLDMISHEFGHGFIYSVSKLSHPGNESAALIESIADVFAIMVKHYHQQTKVNQASWSIARGFLVIPGSKNVALRSMRSPGTAFRGHAELGNDAQVNHMVNFKRLSLVDKGHCHDNSGIPNRAFYLAATSIGGFSWEKAGRIWHQALIASDRAEGFDTFAHRTLLAAKPYGNDVQVHVANAWKSVGVIPQPKGQIPRLVSSSNTAVNQKKTANYNHASSANNKKKDDGPSIGWILVGAFVVGLVAAYLNDKPKTSNK